MSRFTRKLHIKEHGSINYMDNKTPEIKHCLCKETRNKTDVLLSLNYIVKPNVSTEAKYTTRQQTIKNGTISKTEAKQKVPDGDDVREKHNEAEKVAKPGTHKSLQRYHDNRQNHLGQEQGLGETVQLQVQ